MVPGNCEIEFLTVMLKCVPEQANSMVVKRVGLCYWNMSLHRELPSQTRTVVLI